MRDVARFSALWAVYDKAVNKAKAIEDETARRAALREEALPVRAEMAGTLKDIFSGLLRSVSNTGELGTIANWEQHLLPGAWERPEAELAAMLGGELPPEVVLSRAYEGSPRIVVPAVRTSLEAGEALEIKALVLSAGRPDSVVLRWREMGRGAFRSAPLANKARGVYSVTLTPPAAGLEYYVEAVADGRAFRFPVTAPETNQTVIVLPETK
jgi:hypothetical protein